MGDYIDRTLAVLKSKKAPTVKWQALLKVCRTSKKSELWESLPEPKLETDIRAAHQWLVAELGRMPRANAICLGLDTLNMVGRGAFNVGISGGTKAELSEDDLSWAYSCTKRGKPHLIKGLAALRRVYAARRWEEVTEHADYLVPLAYSGLVLSEAAAMLVRPKPLMIAWGFHDGDLFLLGTMADGVFVRKFTVPEA